ncbi:Transcription factor bHLH95 [Vitis vinifera]|uniref:Transcription factor bHLH95 n=1 Tax=Vitis vinifera TaxID=29760 RepID=A0A438FMF7_VITVI|nr:Transcription factor bHLH95 [Vitis vinifera]
MAEGGGHEGFLWENHQTAATGMDLVPPDKKRGRGGAIKNGKNGKGSGEGNEGKGGGGGGGGGGGESDHEIHIWTERERRKKMRNMFSSLHALLPQLPPKCKISAYQEADKSTIVDEAVNYIKTLQHTLQKLQKQKLERLQGATTVNYEPSIITSQKLAFDSREAFLADQGSSSNLAITPSNSSNSLSVARVPAVFQSWTSPNVTLNVCGNEAQISVCSPKKPGLLTTICYVLEKHKLEVISAHVSSDYNRSMYMIQTNANGALDQFPVGFPMEEVYKQAAGEIMFWASS